MRNLLNKISRLIFKVLYRWSFKKEYWFKDERGDYPTNTIPSTRLDEIYMLNADKMYEVEKAKKEFRRNEFTEEQMKAFKEIDKTLCSAIYPNINKLEGFEKAYYMLDKKELSFLDDMCAMSKKCDVMDVVNESIKENNFNYPDEMLDYTKSALAWFSDPCDELVTKMILSCFKYKSTLDKNK